MSAELNIIIRELAELSIVKTDLLNLGADTERQARDEVQDEADEAGHDKGVGKPSDRIGELVAELDVVLVDPATVNGGGAVKSGDVVTGGGR